MKVFVAGATGVLGRRLVRRLTDRGDSVVGLTRSPGGDEVVAAVGGQPRRVDIVEWETLARAAEGCEVIVHAATSIPVKARTRPRDWRMNDKLRTEGTRALAACAKAVGARLLVQQSEVWVARPPDGAFFDEDSSHPPNETSRSALEGEEIAREAGERCGFDVAVLRCGWFYGHDAAHTRMFAEGLRKRRMPITGY